MTSINGQLKGYFYQDGYLRTSCKEFSLHNLSNRMVHLTNDAVQKYADDYGKFESANKLSYSDFQKYLDSHHKDLSINFVRDIVPQIRKLVMDSMKAVYTKIDPNKRHNTFEIYGYDFMLDENFKLYMIEANTNPCLDQCCPLLTRLIPNMVDNAFRVAIDPLFPAPEQFALKKSVIIHEIVPENKFELVFDEQVDGPPLKELFCKAEAVIIELDEEDDEEDTGELEEEEPARQNAQAVESPDPKGAESNAVHEEEKKKINGTQ